MTQSVNSELIKNLDPFFRRRNEPQFVLPDVHALILGMPGLSSYWPGNGDGAVGTLKNLADSSLALPPQGTPQMDYESGTLVTYFDYDSGDSHKHGTTTYWNTTGAFSYGQNDGLTIGCWMNPDRLSTTEALIGKRDGSTQGYLLYKHSGDTIRMAIDNIYGISTSTVSQDTWHYCVARYTPSSEIAVWLDDEKTVNTTSIPAAITTTAVPFEIAYNNNSGSNPFDGSICFSFLSYMAVPDYWIETIYDLSRHIFGV